MFFDFFCNIHARVVQEWNSGLKFIFLFLDLSQPGLDRNNAGIMFLKFRIVLLFFFNILDRVRREQNSGRKSFSLFLGLSHPCLDRNTEGMMFSNFFAIFSLNFLARVVQGMVFFNFLNFFAIVFGIFLSGSSWNEYGTKFFSLSFSSYLTPV